MSPTTLGASMHRIHPVTGGSGLRASVPQQSVRPSDPVWTHRSSWHSLRDARRIEMVEA